MLTGIFRYVIILQPVFVGDLYRVMGKAWFKRGYGNMDIAEMTDGRQPSAQRRATSGRCSRRLEQGHTGAMPGAEIHSEAGRAGGE